MDIARDYLENSLETSLLHPSPEHNVIPEENDIEWTAQEGPRGSSSYTLASDQSVFSQDVDCWIRGSSSPTETTGVQRSRAAVVQRSTLTTASTQGLGTWYFLAMLLPLFSVEHTRPWRCSPSTILNTLETFLARLSSLCASVRCHIRGLARSRLSRELFATAMDAVLVVYAIGFLVLSMYQASIIG